MKPERWAEIQALFEELVELDAAERTRRLRAIGGADPELRAALESLLMADDDADALLRPLESTLVAPVTRDAVASGMAEPMPDLFGLSGRTLSHFRVLEPLGAGGMGMVYRAHDSRLSRDVALKFLLPHFSLDASAKQRFLHEARSAASLDHPNLCTIHEAGESEDGRLFLAMALYPGETLKARLAREGALPVAEALAIARHIAEGLACAHAAGIVHRDLKPGNVMLLPNGGVKILDFGLAKARDSNLSVPSARLGTVSYMAPEQIRGEPVDARADLWALGVVLYEMLTGRRPFWGDSDAAIAHAIVHDEPVRPSVFRADLADDLAERIVPTLLEKDAARRFATADELLDELTAAGPVAARSGRPAGRRVFGGIRLRMRGRRSRMAAAAAIGVISAAAVAVLGRERAPGVAAVAAPVVVMPFENRSADGELDPVGVVAADWIALTLSESGRLTVLDTRTALAAARTLGRGATPPAIGRETGAQLVVTGSYFLQGDTLEFQAQVASAVDGSILLGIGGIPAPRDRPLDGIEGLRQRVLTALASLHDVEVTAFQTGLTQPPTYAAYREYTVGLQLYMRGAREAAQHFQRAAALDTSFLVAQLWAAQSLHGWDRAAVDALLAELRPRRHRLGDFDRARFDFVAALQAGSFQDAYRAAGRMVEAAPESVDAQREAGLSALRILRPAEALERLERLDPGRGLMRDWGLYWDAVAWAHHLRGDYAAELAALRRGRQVEGLQAHFRLLELRALAALGRTAEVDSSIVAELSARSGQVGTVAYAIAGELMAHGHEESARRLAEYAATLLAGQAPSAHTAHEWLPRPIGSVGVLAEAELASHAADEETGPATLERATDEWLHQRAALALLLGKPGAAGEYALRIRDTDAHRLLLARILGAQGRHGAARAALEESERYFLARRGTLRGLEIERAGVLVRIGEADRALQILADGLAQGTIGIGYWGQDGHAHPELAPLWSDPRFRALIAPRG